MRGNSYQCSARMDGAGQKGGYDSHFSPKGNEIIIFVIFPLPLPLSEWTCRFGCRRCCCVTHMIWSSLCLLDSIIIIISGSWSGLASLCSYHREKGSRRARARRLTTTTTHPHPHITSLNLSWVGSSKNGDIVHLSLKRVFFGPHPSIECAHKATIALAPLYLSAVHCITKSLN